MFLSELLDPFIEDNIINEERIKIVDKIRSLDQNTPYYVYFLCYPNGRPFYVGKGKRLRIFSHLSENTGNKQKSNIINHIIRSGSYPILHIVKSNMREDDAYALEKAYISEYGRIGLDDDGILSNVLSGEDSFSSSEISSLGGIGCKNSLSGIFSLDWDRSAQTILNWKTGVYDHINFIENGKKYGEICRDMKVGIHDPQHQHLRSGWGRRGANAHHANMRKDPEKYSQRQANAGRNGGISAYANKKGFHALSNEELFQHRSKGGKTNFKNNTGLFSQAAVENRLKTTRKSVIIEGKIFNNMGDAAEFYDVCNSTITYRIKSKSNNWKNWNYCGEEI